MENSTSESLFNTKNQESFLFSIEDSSKFNIMHNMMKFQEIQKKKRGIRSRNLLNKWFQDSVKNYIMEAHAAPLLVDVFNMHSIHEVKMCLHNRLDKTIPKYMGILQVYYEALIQSKRYHIFCENLSEIINNSSSINMNDTEKSIKNLRKRFICLLILTFFQQRHFNQISTFYDLWNLCFSQEEILQWNNKQEDKINTDSQVFFENQVPCETLKIEESQQEPLSCFKPQESYELSQESKPAHENNFEDNNNNCVDAQQSMFPQIGYSSLDYERDVMFMDNDSEITSFPLTQMMGYLDSSFIPDSYTYCLDDVF